MIVETEDSVLQSDFDVIPAVITYIFGKNGSLMLLHLRLTFHQEQ